MSGALYVGLLTAALYAGFIVWYGGRGRPLDALETEQWLARLAATAHEPQSLALLDSVRGLVARDDGREFIMLNLVRYRARAAYPAGFHYDDDARAADRRYGRAIMPRLLRLGCLPVFIARRSANFIEPEGADAWHYVAMVRYRSKRDFLRFALAVEQHDIAVHKWAAIEKTHVFAVRPLISLILVRGAVGVLLGLAGAALCLLLA
jgi:hypothetical protein